MTVSISIRDSFYKEIVICSSCRPRSHHYRLNGWTRSEVLKKSVVIKEDKIFLKIWIHQRRENMSWFMLQMRVGLLGWLGLLSSMRKPNGEMTNEWIPLVSTFINDPDVSKAIVSLVYLIFTVDKHNTLNGQLLWIHAPAGQTTYVCMLTWVFMCM